MIRLRWLIIEDKELREEGCDDEETNSSLEQMAGVEKACLDDSVVEESTDISRNHSE